MVICAIVGCSKRSGRDNVSFFRIPCVNMKRNFKYSELLLKRQKLWIIRINRKDLDDLKIRHARICSLHFISGKPSSLEDIDNPDWAPSVNLGHDKVQNVSTSIRRYLRKFHHKKKKSPNSGFHHKKKKSSNSDASSDSSSQKNICVDVDRANCVDADPANCVDVDPANCVDMEPATCVGMESASCIDIEQASCVDIEPASCVDMEPASQAATEKKDSACTTDLTIHKISHLEKISADYSMLQNDYLTVKQNMNFFNVDIENFNNDEQIYFYTGLVSSKIMQVVFNFVESCVTNTVRNKLSKFQEFLLFLMRLRLNLLTQDLGYRFNISRSIVCRIFNKWLDIMYIRFKRTVFWPKGHNVEKTMPQLFKETFKDHLAVIIDCFEIVITRPSSLEARNATWSNYKQKNTVKYLIGIMPQGVISFVSLGWGGRSNDKFITEHCGILDNLIPGDIVLADRGFNNINSIGFFCAKLMLPDSAHEKKQLSPIDIEDTRKIASLRIHIEKVIGQLKKNFRILKGALTTEMCITSDDDVAQIDKIVHVCCALFNLMPSVVF